MTEAHFRTQIQRMVGAYGNQGDQAYGRERCQIIFNEMRDLPDFAFTKIVTELIGANLRPPALKEFRELASVERERNRGQSRRDRDTSLDPNLANCKRCCDTGVFPLYRNGGADAFRCNCERGRLDRRPFPIWAGEENDLKNSREVTVSGL